jgi:proteasome alpha subunit
MFSGFDFNEADRRRREHVEEWLRDGSPIVGISFSGGLLLLTVRRSQRKVFEIYDKLIYSALGKQADIESIRIAAIDIATKEGFERSPDDVTVQRLVGFSLSPPLKRLFGDQFNAPAVIRALFGEMGATQEDDLFYTLNYDGEFASSKRFGCVAGSQEAEEKMLARLEDLSPDASLSECLGAALKTWAVGSLSTRPSEIGEADEDPLRDMNEPDAITERLREAIKDGTIEAGVLDRRTHRESKFRLLGDADLAPVAGGYR